MLVFVHVINHLYLRFDPEKSIPEQDHVVNLQDILNKVSPNNLINREEVLLTLKTESNIGNVQQFRVHRLEEDVLLEPVDPKNWFLSKISMKKQPDFSRWSFKIAVFRKQRLKSFFQKVHNNNISLEGCICLARDYFLFDDFTFWIYNPHTEAFTCEFSSKPVSPDFVEKSDQPKDPLYRLHDLYIGKETKKEFRGLEMPCVNYNTFCHMKTINRIVIPLVTENDRSKEVVAVLSLLSHHQDMTLSDDTNSHSNEKF